MPNWAYNLTMSDMAMIYLVRHGQSLGNITENVFIQGQQDFPITPEGEQQAKNLSGELSHIQFEAIFSSDLIRAKRTAEIIAKERRMAVIATRLLREKRVGKYQGKLAGDLKEEFLKLRHYYDSLKGQERLKFKYDKDSESTEEVLIRLIPFLKEIALAYTGKNILLVSHAALLRAFLEHIGHVEVGLGSKLTLENTAYVKVACDGVEFFVKETKGIIFKT
jgi:phosphoserine phosphatase